MTHPPVPPAATPNPEQPTGSPRPAETTCAPHLIQPAGWPPPSGYANATATTLAGGRLVFVAGQVGWDPLTCTFATVDLAAQAAQALANVVTVLRAAQAEPHHLTRLTWYITDRTEYLAARPALAAAYRTHLGRHYPAMSLLVVHSLLEPQAKVEIEATAVVPNP
jgi:enamine deaminase RidA (YjgF/YER057c/UK114 family)